jgi:hypothetical protein
MNMSSAHATVSTLLQESGIRVRDVGEFFGRLMPRPGLGKLKSGGIPKHNFSFAN